MLDPTRSRQLRTVIGFAFVGAMFGVGYVVLSFPVTWLSLTRGVLTGALIAGGIVTAEIVARSSRLAAPLRRLAFVPFIVAKSLLWVGWITGSLVLTRLVLPIPGIGALEGLGVDISYALVVSFALTLMFELDRLLGPGTLWRLLAGRYHTPRVEERAFLLLDLAGSTAIAERIGPAGFLELLDFVIRELTPAIVDSRAEIYRYIGDAIIVTWPIDLAIEESRILACLGRVVRCMREIGPECERRFGVRPTGRAVLHAGPIAIGEVGELKREITMLGDTLNTTVKLEKICGILGHRSVISHDLMSRLTLPAGLIAAPLGEIEIPGRANPIRLYGLG